MDELTSDKPIFIITNDPLRGIGLETVRDNVYLICVDHTPVVDWLVKQNRNVFCIEKELGQVGSVVRNSRIVLDRPEVQSYILKHSKDVLGIVFFKPLAALDEILKKTVLVTKRRVVSLNADLRVSNQLENKLDFYQLCVENGLPTPKSTQAMISQLDYQQLVSLLGFRFVVQFERGWFGNHTYFINSEADFDSIIKTYSDREVKVAEYIEGDVLTVNGVVGRNDIFQTKPFLQINESQDDPSSTSKIKLARLAGTTVGNQWFGTARDDNNLRVHNPEILSLTNTIGKIAQKMGYLGYFGLDYLVSADGRVYLQEMNARFTASVQTITQLEREVVGASLLDAHFNAFSVEMPDAVVRKISSDDLYVDLQGVRVVARNTETQSVVVDNLPQNGVYRFEGDQINFIREDFNLATLGTDEMILLSVASGRVVNPDQEILQLQTRYGKKDKIIQTIQSFKSQITTTAGDN